MTRKLPMRPGTAREVEELKRLWRKVYPRVEAELRGEEGQARPEAPEPAPRAVGPEKARH